MTNPLHIFRNWQQRRREKRMQKEREEAERLKRDIEAFGRFCAETSRAAALLVEISSRMSSFVSGGIVSPNANEGGEYIAQPHKRSRRTNPETQLARAIESENYELAAVLRDRIKKSKEA